MPFAAYCSFHSELYPIYSLCAISLLNVPFTFLPYLTPGWPCGAAFPVAPPVLAVFCLTQLLAPRWGLSSTLRVVSRSPSAPLCQGWPSDLSSFHQNCSYQGHRAAPRCSIWRLLLPSWNFLPLASGTPDFFPSFPSSVCVCLVAQSCPTLCDPWTVSCQASLSMEFSRQEYWSGLPCPPPGDLPNPGMEIRSPASQVDSLPTKSPGKPNLVASPNPSGSSSRHRHVQILLNLPSKYIQNLISSYVFYHDHPVQTGASKMVRNHFLHQLHVLYLLTVH